MHNFMEKLFLGEISKQSDFAFKSVNILKQGLKENNIDLVWYSLQGFLVSVGNISKIIWPLDKYKQRGDHLKNLLGLDDKSCLKLRYFRNVFEHFDERLDDWGNKNKNKVFIDSNLGDMNTFIAGVDNSCFLRNFDPQKGILSYQNKEYNIQEVVLEINEIYKKIESLKK